MCLSVKWHFVVLQTNFVSAKTKERKTTKRQRQNKTNKKEEKKKRKKVSEAVKVGRHAQKQANKVHVSSILYTLQCSSVIDKETDAEHCGLKCNQ